MVPVWQKDRIREQVTVKTLKNCRGYPQVAGPHVCDIFGVSDCRFRTKVACYAPNILQEGANALRPCYQKYGPQGCHSFVHGAHVPVPQHNSWQHPQHSRGLCKYVCNDSVNFAACRRRAVNVHVYASAAARVSTPLA